MGKASMLRRWPGCTALVALLSGQQLWVAAAGEQVNLSWPLQALSVLACFACFAAHILALDLIVTPATV